ncbi:hypothetical protein HMSSN036_41710 [Paenibacillus macerans]|nr:hypothetical protein HMSSN036_41710 [Paenibacillus macerans]
MLRDSEKERQILELMEASSFAKTESGYFLDNEEAEYEFLYHVVPELEKLLEIYATSAVKVRLLSDLRRPKFPWSWTSVRTGWSSALTWTGSMNRKFAACCWLSKKKDATTAFRTER